MKPIKEWRSSERPRERLIAYGPSALSDAELLSIILRTGGARQTAVELARELLEKFGGFRGFEDVSVNELAGIKNVGMVKAVQIKACLEIAKRYLSESSSKKTKIPNKDELVKFCRDNLLPYMRDVKKEVFKAILLDSRNRVIKITDISVGTLEFSPAHPREVLREAVKEAASGIIIVHNHPSGEALPSADDIRVTERIEKSCEILGIRFLDHLIIGDNRVFSFLEHGLIPHKP